MPRPRIHPIGQEPTSTERVEASRQALAASGGARREFRLSSVAVAALATLRTAGGDASDSATVERVLTAAARRLSR